MQWRDLPTFRAPKYLLNGHAQTIVSHLWPAPQMGAGYERWIVKLEDGDEIWCRFYPGHEKRLALFFHGLGGCADSKYIQACGLSALQLGYSVLLVNHRGSGEGWAHARGIYHSGAVQDVAAVIRFAREKMPRAEVTAVGFSLSANLLLNVGAWLNEDLPDRMIVVNPPIDLHETARHLLAPQNFVYDQKFVRDLKIAMANKLKAGLIDELPALPKFCRLVDFDRVVTAPFAKYASRDEYYTKCSSLLYADKIKPPTLILTAEDDPFIPAEPFRRAKYPKHVQLQIEERGGHCGFLTRDGRWLAEFMTAALK